MTGSGDNLQHFCKYRHHSKSKTGLYIKPYTRGLDRQWATATYTVNSNYFRFAPIVISLMRKQLSHTGGMSDLSYAETIK